MSSKITTPYPLFNDVDGRPLDAGFVFIGEAGKNPEVYPISVFWDENLTVPAEQPIRTRNGYFAKNGRAGKLYVADADCSITAKNKKQVVVHTDLFADLFFGQKDVVKTVETINDLKYLVPWDGRTVYVKGYYKATNFALAQPYKGGGTRIYVASRSNENDGFLCINGWVLQVENSTVSPSHAGGKNDTSFDSSDAVQKALLYAGETLLDDYYYTKKPVWFPVSKVIKGVGKWSCGLVKNGDDSVLSLVHDKTTGRTVLDKNAVLIGYADRPNTTYCEELRLSDFSLKYTGSLTNSIGLYIPTLCRSIFSNLLIEDVSIGVKTSDSWLCSWINVHIRNSDIPFKFGDSDGTLIVNGTSNNMLGCYAEVVKLNAYWFKNYQYSTMTGCAADKVSHAQNDGSSIYVFDNTDMVLNSCGCEHITTRHLIAKNGSNIVFNLGNFILDNKFQDETTWWQQTNTLLSISNESKVTFNNTKFSISNQNRDGLSKFAAFACVDGGCKLELNNISSYTSQIVNFVEASEYKTYNSLDIYYVSGSIIEMKTPLGVYEYAASGGRSSWFNGTAKTQRLVDTFKSYSTNAFAIPTDISLTQLSNTYQTVVAAQTSPGAATAALEYPYPNTAHLIYQMSAKRHAGDNLLAQLAIPIWTANNNVGQGALRIRYKQGASAFSDWITFRTSSNTTVDANGFVKSASPICHLYTDKIDLNDEAKLQSIGFEKVGVGDYLVTGSLGFAQEGWYIEMPKDANGNVLVAVVYKQLENNDISIKTYAKKFDDEAGDIVPNLSKPRDIPENRSITLRLQELPKVEQEIVPE